MQENKNNKPLQKKQFPFFTVLLCAFLVIILVMSFLPRVDNLEIKESDFRTDVEAGNVDEVYIYGTSVKVLYTAEESELTAEDRENFPEKYDGYFNLTSLYEVPTLKAFLDDKGVVYTSSPVEESWISKIWPFIYIALIIMLAVFVFRAFNKMSGKNMDFGKNKARMETNLKVRFDDVAGCEEEKREMMEIVEFLKNPKKFTELGAHIPKGVLMVGPPGTGKTLLGKAIAGEAGVPFFSITGSDFVEMFVGVGAARVRDLFDTAKRSSPCLIFIDEIDAVGRQRGAGLGNTNDEREQTLNQLLVQMDGFESNEGIIVIAATNRPDVLDPALLRAGRFDRRITVSPPDVRGREKILRLYTKDKPMATGIDYESIARHLVPGTTGADIENIVNEAAILAARDNRSQITKNDIMEGIVKVAMGPQRRSAVVSDKDKKQTAYHEAGHAIVSGTTENLKLTVQEVSIIPRGMGAGYTSPSPKEDHTQYTREQILDHIELAMAGRAAEWLIYGNKGTGASNDIKQATNLARAMVTEYGMSDKLGPVRYASEGEVFLGRDFQAHNNISEKTSELIDSEVRSIIEDAEARALERIKKYRKELEVMVEVLLEKETIYSSEVELILAGKTTKQVIAAMNKREKERQQEELKLRKQKVEAIEKQRQEEEDRVRELREKALAAFNGDSYQPQKTESKVEPIVEKTVIEEQPQPQTLVKTTKKKATEKPKTSTATSKDKTSGKSPSKKDDNAE